MTSSARVRVARRFYDRVAGRWREAGGEFACELARAEEISRAIPGYVDYEATEPETAEPGTVDVSSLTAAQLRGLARERGVAVPARATKAELAALLEG